MPLDRDDDQLHAIWYQAGKQELVGTARGWNSQSECDTAWNTILGAIWKDLALVLDEKADAPTKGCRLARDKRTRGGRSQQHQLKKMIARCDHALRL